MSNKTKHTVLLEALEFSIQMAKERIEELKDDGCEGCASMCQAESNLEYFESVLAKATVQ